MRRAIFTAGLTAAMLIGCTEGAGEPRAEMKLPEIIATAKGRVFPALVFIKPVQENFYTGRRERAEVFGSGGILSTNGYLVTNCHVAAGAVATGTTGGPTAQSATDRSC